MNKSIIFLIALSALGVFLYYSTQYEKEGIRLEKMYQDCEKETFNVFSKKYSIEISKSIIEEGALIEEKSVKNGFFYQGNLDWEDLRIKSIPDSFFYYYPCIEILNLEQNQLQEIPSSIEFLKDLKELNFSNNQVKTIPTAFINRKSSIQSINLSHNKIQTFPNSFSQFPHLYELQLQNNEISGEVILNSFSILNNLNLANNKIRTFNMDEESSKYLKSLSLNNNKIQKFIQDNADYSWLSFLDLSQNELDSFSLGGDDFSVAFTRIKHLSLRENNLQELHFPYFYSLMTKLDISNNRLKMLPKLNMPSLLELNISNNQISKLPKTILERDNLERFFCSENNLSGALEWENRRLEELILSDNQIEEIFITKSPNLKIIKLDGNQLKSFLIDSESLISLETLSLHNNPELADIPLELILKNAWNLSVFSLENTDVSIQELEKLKEYADARGIVFWYENQILEN